MTSVYGFLRKKGMEPEKIGRLTFWQMEFEIGKHEPTLDEAEAATVAENRQKTKDQLQAAAKWLGIFFWELLQVSDERLAAGLREAGIRRPDLGQVRKTIVEHLQ